MNQYEKAHAISKIDGYVFPRPSESPEQAFLRAQRETVAAYQRTLANLVAITFQQFQVGRKGYEKLLLAAGVDAGELLATSEAA